VNNAASAASFRETEKFQTPNHCRAAINRPRQPMRLATLCCDVAATEGAIKLSRSLAASRNCVAARRPAMPIIVMFWLKNPT
jgi:hypothetical protein